MNTPIQFQGLELGTWINEPWYVAQTPRWDALEAQGWQFRRPSWVFNRVGLTMFREGDEYAWYIPKDQTPEEIHTKLLERCEYHARSFKV